MYAKLLTTALAIAPTTLISRQAGSTYPATLNCPASDGCTSTTANGAVFRLKYTTDYNGPIIEINQCATACSVIPVCKGLNYEGRFCYLLGSNTGAPKSASKVNAATQINSAIQASPTPGSSTCAAGPTCPAGDGYVYTAEKKKFYTRCAIEFYSGDIASGFGKQATFKACVVRCSTTKGCVAVSYDSGSCYLKSVLKPGVYSANTSGAYIS